MLLIYEIVFNGLFKLIYSEVNASKVDSSVIRGSENNKETDEVQKANEDPNGFASLDGSSQNKYSDELVLLLIEIISFAGLAINNTLRMHHVSDTNSTRGCLNKKPMNQSISKRNLGETEIRYKNNFSAIKLELEKVCEYHGEQIRQIKKQETNKFSDNQANRLNKKLKIDELFALCNPEFSASKGLKSGSAGLKITKNPREILVAISAFIQIHREELQSEINHTLKYSSLKIPRLVTHYNH